MNTRDVYFVAGVRTAIGGFGGSLKDQAPADLAGKVVAEALKRSRLDPSQIGHCVFGNVVPTERRDLYLSRVAALQGGLADITPALNVNRLCGSGLQAIITAAQQIQLGLCDAAIAGGAESMSRTNYWMPSGRWGQRMGDAQVLDSMVGALTCPMENIHMGVTAENIAEKWHISREDQDLLALQSHQRAQHAIEQGRFASQILPVTVKTRKGEQVFDTDEHLRFNCTLEEMQTLRPVFKKDGTVTAGNASGLNDAAAAVVLASGELIEKTGVKPMAKLIGYAFVGVEPKYMGIGPVPAVKHLLNEAELQVGDIDLWEVNEAFAAQALAVVRDLDLPNERVNPNGSGISLGHPIGATGAVISVKALYELERIHGRYAVITMCIGGGQGIAALIERCA
ncbi:acetyl-CoA C-acyltransferase family protein [Nitrincola schmidtii]|uniref:acetyl-CoA C-acyltransferase family protein n=1 Tax=Nitrincola schmidtii TaxID=1730894 RepID=UPI00124D1FF6|nr:acetyl-CoA C-acyltransferase family protein [Nitrincola schmidtii]